MDARQRTWTAPIGSRQVRNFTNEAVTLHTCTSTSWGFDPTRETSPRPRQINARGGSEVVSCFRALSKTRTPSAVLVEVRSKRAHHPVSSPSGRRGTLCRGSLAKGLRKPPVLCRASGTRTLWGENGRLRRRGVRCAGEAARLLAGELAAPRTRPPSQPAALSHARAGRLPGP